MSNGVAVDTAKRKRKRSESTTNLSVAGKASKMDLFDSPTTVDLTQSSATYNDFATTVSTATTSTTATTTTPTPFATTFGTTAILSSSVPSNPSNSPPPTELSTADS